MHEIPHLAHQTHHIFSKYLASIVWFLCFISQQKIISPPHHSLPYYRPISTNTPEQRFSTGASWQPAAAGSFMPRWRTLWKESSGLAWCTAAGRLISLGTVPEKCNYAASRSGSKRQKTTALEGSKASRRLKVTVRCPEWQIWQIHFNHLALRQLLNPWNSRCTSEVEYWVHVIPIKDIINEDYTCVLMQVILCTETTRARTVLRALDSLVTPSLASDLIRIKIKLYKYFTKYLFKFY